MNKHGMWHHPVYKVWATMKQRCQNPKNQRYADYGGRGIKVCDRWQDPVNFIEDMFHAWKQGLTLDRINNDGNYEPSNCRWATRKEQRANQREPQACGEIPLKGVTRIGKNYRARIRVKGKRISLGMFNTAEEASEAYNESYRSLRL